MTVPGRVCRTLVKLLHGAVNIVVLAVLLSLFLMGAYVQWDSHQMLRQAETIAYEAYRPTDAEHLTFSELTERNPDVFAWLTIENTKVDYPVAQGKDNEYYVNTDVLGKFSLSGSIFLDYRNRRDFSDEVSILHGHHMADDVMFGGLDRFADRGYFASHRSGSLFYGDSGHEIEIFAFLRADAYDTEIYDPRVDAAEKADFVRHLLERAEQSAEDAVDLSRPIVLMSTCEYSETNGRMILAATVGEEIGQESSTGVQEQAQRHDAWKPAVGILAAGIAALLLVLHRRRRKEKQRSHTSEKSLMNANEHAPKTESEEKTPGSVRQPSLGAEVFLLLVKLAAIAVVFAALFTFVFGLHISTDESMSPAVKYRDIAVYYRLDKQPDARDLVVYEDASGEVHIGRIVAVGGDSVDVTSEGLKINGYLQQETYASGETLAYQEGVTYPVKLEPGEYFVLGDSREQSADSRLFGAIPENRIKGRVITLVRHQNL